MHRPAPSHVRRPNLNRCTLAPHCLCPGFLSFGYTETKEDQEDDEQRSDSARKNPTPILKHTEPECLYHFLYTLLLTSSLATLAAGRRKKKWEQSQGRFRDLGTKSKVVKREMTEAIRFACIALLVVIYVHTCAGEAVIPVALELIYSPVRQIFYSCWVCFHHKRIIVIIP